MDQIATKVQNFFASMIFTNSNIDLVQISTKLRVGFFARRDFLLASNQKKNASHRTISENGNRTASYPMADFAHFSTQNHAIKNSIVSKYSP
jgi:hypothetical protein